MFGSTCGFKEPDCVGVCGFSAGDHDEDQDLCDDCRKELREEDGRCGHCGEDGSCDCLADAAAERAYEVYRDERD